MKTILLTLTYLVGIGELILAIYFWVTNSKSEIRRVMAFLATTTGLWVILSGMTSYVAFSAPWYYVMASVYVLGALSVTLVLHLSLIMPYRLFAFDRLHAFLIYVPVIIFSYILFFSRAIITSFVGSPDWAGVVNGGILYGLYNSSLFLMYIIALIIYLYRIKKTDGETKKFLWIIFWSYFIGSFPAAFLYLVVANFYPTLPINTLFGVIPTAVWIGGTSYIIKKK